MSNLLNVLLDDQRKIEDRRAAPKHPEPVIGLADRIIAAGHAQRTAHRCKFPDADTAMVYGAQIGYLHGEVRRLCDELDAGPAFPRDPDLLYFEVTCDELSADVWAGVSHDPGSPERITSAAYFERTGDPGDPGEAESTELMEVWIGGVDVAPVLLERVAEQILQSAVDRLHSMQAKARDDDEAARYER